MRPILTHLLAFGLGIALIFTINYFSNKDVFDKIKKNDLEREKLLVQADSLRNVANIYKKESETFKIKADSLLNVRKDLKVITENLENKNKNNHAGENESKIIVGNYTLTELINFFSRYSEE